MKSRSLFWRPAVNRLGKPVAVMVEVRFCTSEDTQKLEAAGWQPAEVHPAALVIRSDYVLNSKGVVLGQGAWYDHYGKGRVFSGVEDFLLDASTLPVGPVRALVQNERGELVWWYPGAQMMGDWGTILGPIEGE